jgi:hypothetical protein
MGSLVYEEKGDRMNLRPSPMQLPLGLHTRAAQPEDARHPLSAEINRVQILDASCTGCGWRLTDRVHWNRGHGSGAAERTQETRTVAGDNEILIPRLMFVPQAALVVGRWLRSPTLNG